MRSELRRCRALVLVVVAAFAVACSQDDPEDVLDASDMDDPDEMMDTSGGDDPGDGDTGDGDTGDGDGDAGDATDAPTGTLHFPMADGARWVYAHTGGNNDWEETVTMVATTHEGEPAILMSDTPGPSMTFSESVLVQDGDVVRRVYKEIILGQLIQSTVTYDPGFARFDEGWVEGGAGHQTTLEYQRVEVDNTDAVLDEQRSHQYDVLATDVEIEVPAGSFSDCVEIERLRLRSAMEMMLPGDHKRFVFCPGVGKVRELEIATMEVEELISCDIPGGACP